jgi:hypothetical protein
MSVLRRFGINSPRGRAPRSERSQPLGGLAAAQRECELPGREVEGGAQRLTAVTVGDGLGRAQGCGLGAE